MVLVEQWALGAQEAALQAEEKRLGVARWVRQQRILLETELPGVKRMVSAHLVLLWVGTEVWQM
eukprot:14357972-Ditylum_brightwellii.AAC.1